ncbi:MAG TPA: hypothetical protein VHB02_18360 [Acidimicrobiales bacterium]|nr:hypothetical protein [Acidimicrobiales bacterium]
MGFLDKMKEQAAVATAVAKDAAQKGQAKLDEMQAKRAADGLLRDLGAVIYGQRSGRASSTADADADRLVDALKAHEQAHGLIDLSPTATGGYPGSPGAGYQTPPGA